VNIISYLLVILLVMALFCFKGISIYVKIKKRLIGRFRALYTCFFIMVFGFVFSVFSLEKTCSFLS